jgi:hypothetical protein
VEATKKKLGFWMVDKNVARLFGYEAAALVAEIVWRRKLYDCKEVMSKNGFIYLERDQIEKELFLTHACQRRVTKELSEFGLMHVKKIGLPARNYYKIEKDVLVRINRMKLNGLYDDWKRKNKRLASKKFGKKRYIKK